MTSLKKILLASAFCVAGSVFAPAAQAAEAGELTGFIALGGIYTPDYEGSDDYEANPFGAARLEYNQYYIETNGPGLRANISSLDNIEFGPAFGYRGERDNDVENDAVSRLRDIDGAFEAGAFVKVKTNGVMDPTDELSFGVDVLTDISDTHEGTLVSFGPSYSYSPSAKWRLSTSLNATYVSDDYAETYFGVDADNSARSGLAAYDAEGGLHDVGLTLMANYMINDRWGVIGLVGYEKLLGDAADSPIVDREGDDNQLMIGAGISYRF